MELSVVVELFHRMPQLETAFWLSIDKAFVREHHSLEFPELANYGRTKWSLCKEFFETVSADTTF